MSKRKQVKVRSSFSATCLSRGLERTSDEEAAKTTTDGGQDQLKSTKHRRTNKYGSVKGCFLFTCLEKASGGRIGNFVEVVVGWWACGRRIGNFGADFALVAVEWVCGGRIGNIIALVALDAGA